MNDSQPIKNAMGSTCNTWNKNKDGVMMIDYSSQEPNSRKGRHASTIGVIKFKNLISSTIEFSYDLMLEIKDKEKSAFKSQQILGQISNFTLK